MRLPEEVSKKREITSSPVDIEGPLPWDTLVYLPPELDADSLVALRMF
jgi:hypothetical protein